MSIPEQEGAPGLPEQEETHRGQQAATGPPPRRPTLEAVTAIVNAGAAVAMLGVTVVVGLIAADVQQRANDIQDEAVHRQRSRDYFDMRIQAAQVGFVRNGPTGPAAGAVVVTNRSADPLPGWGLVYGHGRTRHLLRSPTSVRACAAYRVDERSAAAAVARTGVGDVELRGFYFRDRYGRYWERGSTGSITDIDGGRPPQGHVTGIDPNAFVELEPGVDGCGDEGGG